MRERAVRTRRKPLGARKAFKVFHGITRHELKHGFYVFHESRDTKHESRPFYRVLRPSGGEKCRLGASRAEEKGARNKAFKVFTNHETRITKHGFYVFHETRITAFLSCPSTVGW